MRDVADLPILGSAHFPLSFRLLARSKWHASRARVPGTVFIRSPSASTKQPQLSPDSRPGAQFCTLLQAPAAGVGHIVVVVKTVVEVLVVVTVEVPVVRVVVSVSSTMVPMMVVTVAPFLSVVVLVFSSVVVALMGDSMQEHSVLKKEAASASSLESKTPGPVAEVVVVSLVLVGFVVVLDVVVDVVCLSLVCRFTRVSGTVAVLVVVVVDTVVVSSSVSTVVVVERVEVERSVSVVVPSTTFVVLSVTVTVVRGFS
ncbi:hypothetical protein NA57DRAFT_52341 [Rhizodiscina lignyota]|uniref:Uncharacterized protein n=1 Tax=Rhizodiscina lignyota TaxID=1504668 RepID=A0A9P4MEN9_9PEZI|nr:hypothetical protein NA57DRAFT_52341 [Rhizodiscina lignyota]